MTSETDQDLGAEHELSAPVNPEEEDEVLKQLARKNKLRIFIPLFFVIAIAALLRFFPPEPPQPKDGSLKNSTDSESVKP